MLTESLLTALFMTSQLYTSLPVSDFLVIVEYFALFRFPDLSRSCTPEIVKIYLDLLKLCAKHWCFPFFGHGVDMASLSSFICSETQMLDNYVVLWSLMRRQCRRSTFCICIASQRRLWRVEQQQRRKRRATMTTPAGVLCCSDAVAAQRSAAELLLL